jgi:hypothetical protein
MKVQKLKDIVDDHGHKIILHGRGGSGKTWSIKTLPYLDQTIILSAESGLRTIRKECPDVDVKLIMSIDDLREAYDFLNEGEGVKKYKTVVIDSLSDIAQQILSKEMSQTKDGRKAYGNTYDIVERLVKSFRDLSGKNVILICQQSRMQDQDGRVLCGPSMPGQRLPQLLEHLTDFVACLRVRKDDDGNVERALQFSTMDEQYVSKKRGDELDDYEPVDWTLIFNKIESEGE